ncbi:MAG TPA: TrmH family RNA methyltransferase [Methanofastidiosum sp.]|nr:TrmH family RNA methyltransferase [Methanofastidiosum sp.]
MKRDIIGKNSKPIGLTPSIALINPKYPRNVGQAIRAASCFDVKQVWFTGDRVSLDVAKGQRLPREERMKGYSKVELVQFDYFFDQFKDVTPVAVEVSPNAEVLTTFKHPENALYIFGPEDGSIPQVTRKHCHRFVVIPTRHCTNLAAAIYIILYDRFMKRQLDGLEPILPASDILDEPRGWAAFEDKTGEDYKNDRIFTIEELLT